MTRERGADLTGQTCGRLRVISSAKYAEGKQKRMRTGWLCICDPELGGCGTVRVFTTSNLRSGNSQSCGCLHKEQLISRSTRHGGSHTRLYNIWCGMINRCSNPSQKEYSRYGGRGITVCPEWRADFTAFQSWALQNGYADDLSIDRIDPDGNYCPKNCRWVTMKEQQRNKGNTRRITHKGDTLTLNQWAQKTGINAECIRDRLARGWTVERALTVQSAAHK